MGIPIVADRVENNPNNPKSTGSNTTKNQQIADARKAYRKAVDRIDDGKALIAHYEAKAYKTFTGSSPATMSSTPVAVQRWSSGANKGLLKSMTLDYRNTIYVNTKEYLNPFFPDGKLSGPVTIKFYPLESALIPDTKSVLQAPAASVIKNSGKYWYEKLWPLDIAARINKLPGFIAEWREAKKAAAARLKALGVAEKDYYSTGGDGKGNGNGNGNGNGDGPKNKGHNYANEAISYNVGMVNEAYFSTDAGFSQLVNMMDGGSRPSAVSAGTELWNNSKSNKGMIWLYSGTQDDKLSFEAPDRQAENGTYKKYGFQFHYNPTTIQQAWSGSPDVDVTMWTANLEKYNLLGGQTMSTVTFSLTLNRIFDMQYYGKDGLLKPGRRGDKNPYSPMKPTEEDQKKIYDFGTMYDVEFLLSTVLGFKYKSRFRGTTSDIGFMTGRPVDLHLGNSLRYWGYIQSIGLNHVIFDERMVPILSSVDITFARIPDYKE